MKIRPRAQLEMQQWMRISSGFLQCWVFYDTQVSPPHDDIIGCVLVLCWPISLPVCWNGHAGHASGPVHAACPWLCGSPARTSGTPPRFQRNSQSSAGGRNDCTGSELTAVPGGCCTCCTWSSGISSHFCRNAEKICHTITWQHNHVTEDWYEWQLCASDGNIHLFPSTPRLQVLDLRAQVSSFHSVLGDFALIIFYLLALPLQLVNQVVLDDWERGCGIVCQRLHHCNNLNKTQMNQ